MNFHGGLGTEPASLPLGRTIRPYYVRPRFRAFLEDLKITKDQADDGETKNSK